MNRGKFIRIAGVSIGVAAAGFYLLSDKSNFERNDMKAEGTGEISFKPDEKEILFLASLAPSGHNTQPWFVNYLEPYHWIIGNDKTRWLPGVDPTQRETILSIGAFLQNLEFAAGNFGYDCQFTILAASNRDENIVEVKLTRAPGISGFDVEEIKKRRTVRSEYLDDPFTENDIAYLTEEGKHLFYFFPNSAKEYSWLNEQTIEANRQQSYRDAAQSELANWIRFSRSDAKKNNDGLTVASMEIEGVPAWVLRNFYGRSDIMKKGFREQTIDKVVQQVRHSAGWLLITSESNSVVSLLETGRRLQRLLLKIRQRNIAIHPMTQVLEESPVSTTVNQATGISAPIQFVLRTGYIKKYPEPVSLRRPVDWFVFSVRRH